jgi:hypothetical protein
MSLAIDAFAGLAQSGNSRRRANELKPGLQKIDVSEIYPSPENALLYRERTVADVDFARLVESVREGGVQAPLLVSRDRMIISGHQRRAAAIEADCYEVPIIVLPIRRSDYTKDEWLAVLREHNTGREKTLDERILENLVDVDPDEAMSAVVDEQVRRPRPKSSTVYVPAKFKKRAKITGQTRAFADAIMGILDGVLKDALPVPERAIHYHLLPLKVRTSRGRSGYVYENDKESAGALSRMLTRLRLCGEVPWNSICDETRPVAKWRICRDAAAFLKAEMADLYSGFARDLMQSQSAYYEIVLEKLTIKGFIDKVAAKYTIPTVTLRGNSSIDARYRLSERFKASGKKSLVLFVLADCDPAGDSICESTVHSLRDEFGIDGVKAIRVAMTHAQADKYHLATSLDDAGQKGKKSLKIKKSSVQPKFEQRHGRSDCYELEAVPPEVLAGWLDEQIRGNIDVEAYNFEVAEQAKDVAKVRATRTATLAAIRTSTDDKELD